MFSFQTLTRGHNALDIRTGTKLLDGLRGQYGSDRCKKGADGDWRVTGLKDVMKLNTLAVKRVARPASGEVVQEFTTQQTCPSVHVMVHNEIAADIRRTRETHK